MLKIFIISIIYIIIFIVYTDAVGFSNFRSDWRFWKVVLDWAMIFFLAIAIFLASLSVTYLIVKMVM